MHAQRHSLDYASCDPINTSGRERERERNANAHSCALSPLRSCTSKMFYTHTHNVNYKERTREELMTLASNQFASRSESAGDCREGSRHFYIGLSVLCLSLPCIECAAQFGHIRGCVHYRHELVVARTTVPRC